jgi:prophage regulatory protein
MQNTSKTLLRLPLVLARIPVKKSAWYAGVKSGQYPLPVHLTPGGRASFWKSEDVDRLIDSAT